jgi:hypothetical protein
MKSLGVGYCRGDRLVNGLTGSLRSELEYGKSLVGLHAAD